VENKMKVVILCGGQGTRLREMTEFIPKPMVEIGGKPILWHIMKYYSHFGHNEFILLLGYKGNIIKDYFLNYLAMNSDFTINTTSNEKIEYHNIDTYNFKVTLVNTGLDSATGGRIRQASSYLENYLPFMITYGDGLCTVDISGLLHSHIGNGAKLTITAVKPQSRFGIIDIDKYNDVIGFREKPDSDNYINAGFMVAEKDIVNYIKSDTEFLEKEPISRLVEENNVHAYIHNGFFQQMDTYRDYLLLNDLWNSGKAPWKVW